METCYQTIYFYLFCVHILSSSVILYCGLFYVLLLIVRKLHPDMSLKSEMRIWGVQF
jgi:hypothetical protein